MTWASIIAGALKFFNALAAFFQSRRDEELGRLRAEEKGRKDVEEIIDRLDRVDSNRLPKPPDEPRRDI